jgi:uncharacterized membrane protein
VEITVDYTGEPEIREANPRGLKITLRNPAAQATVFSLRLEGCPEGWKVSGLPEDPVEVARKSHEAFEIVLAAASVEAGPYRLSLEVGGAGEPIAIPITLVGRKTPKR